MKDPVKLPRALVLITAGVLQMVSLPLIHASTLMEEGFNYPTGTGLATNSPWAGTANASLAIASSSLSVTNLRSTFPAGNKLQISNNATATARRSFSPTAISNDVYCAFLINCSTLPTNQQAMVALLRSGATGASPPDDPVDFYIRPSGSGYAFTITCLGSDPASAGTILATNTSHLIVLKYAFGTIGQASLYIDPTPGGTEPLNPDTSTSSDDNIGAANLQVIAFRSSAGQSVCAFDTVRVGTNWSDVTPLTVPLTLAGPQNQAICSGSPATFSITANGTPPYFYQWRTNGAAVPGATNSTYQLLQPTEDDALNGYDVVVQDSFGTVTSQVVNLTISTTPASIKTQPTNPIVTPSSTNAIFNVIAAGDGFVSFQWRTNGIAIPGATNSTYTLTNPFIADPSLQYDVIVSNPCGSVTSSPPVSLLFPNVFYQAYDAGPGFFSGENLVLTNIGGLTLYSWSSSSVAVPITQWNLEGQLQEQPLNDGTGKSFYSINVTPATSPVYYIFGASVSPPYFAPIPILTITTDPSGFYIVANSQMSISSNGTLSTPAITLSIAPHSGGGADLSCFGIAENSYSLQMTTNLQQSQWLTIQTNMADSSGAVHFVITNGPPDQYFRLLGQ